MRATDWASTITVEQLFYGGEASSHGRKKHLFLYLMWDSETGKLLEARKDYPVHYIGAPILMTRRMYYHWARTYAPKQVMTEEERRRAHLLANKKYKRKKRLEARQAHAAELGNPVT